MSLVGIREDAPATTYLTEESTKQFWTIEDLEKMSDGENLDHYGLCLMENGEIDLARQNCKRRLLVSANTLFEMAIQRFGKICDRKYLIIFLGKDYADGSLEYEVVATNPITKQLEEFPRINYGAIKPLLN